MIIHLGTYSHDRFVDVFQHNPKAASEMLRNVGVDALDPEDEEWATRQDNYVLLRVDEGVRWERLLGRLMTANADGGFSGSYDCVFVVTLLEYEIPNSESGPTITVVMLSRDTLGREEFVWITNNVDSEDFVVLTPRRHETWVETLLRKDVRKDEVGKATIPVVSEVEASG